MGIGIVRLQFDCAAKAGDRFADLSASRQSHAQVELHLGSVRTVRHRFQRTAASGNGLVEISLLPINRGQIVVRIVGLNAIAQAE